jgi:hypothetical protein
MRPSQFFARRRTVLPDLSPLLLICMLPALPLLLAGLLGLSANPLPSTSGLAIGLKGGVLPGFPWIDPNSGTTTQALGRLAASGWLDGSMPWWNPFAGAEFADERAQVGVDDAFSGKNLLELTVVGSPAHPLGFCDAIANAALRPELAPQLEGAPQRPVVSHAGSGTRQPLGRSPRPHG